MDKTLIERCERALDNAPIDFGCEPVTIDSDDLRALIALAHRAWELECEYGDLKGVFVAQPSPVDNRKDASHE